MFNYTDTLTHNVQGFDYDLSTGQVANPRVIITVPETLGWPNVTIIDTKDKSWSAKWGWAQVTRWNLQIGQLRDQIAFPAKHVPSCAFGREKPDELSITSAWGKDGANSTAYRHSGGLMRIKTKARGMVTFESE